MSKYRDLDKKHIDMLLYGICFLFLLSMRFLDNLTTYIALHLGFKELNPLSWWRIWHFGFIGNYVFEVWFVFTFLFVFFYLNRHSDTRTMTMIGYCFFLGSLSFIVACINIFVLVGVAPN